MACFTVWIEDVPATTVWAQSAAEAGYFASLEHFGAKVEAYLPTPASASTAETTVFITCLRLPSGRHDSVAVFVTEGENTLQVAENERD